MIPRPVFDIAFVFIALLLYYAHGYDDMLVGFAIGYFLMLIIGPVVNKLKERRKDKNVVQST